MTQRPPALLIDDDDLELVKAILEDLNADFCHLRGSKTEPPLPDPTRLLVTTARLAVSLPCRRVRRGNGSDAIWMAFVQSESRTQQQLLRKAGFDYLIPEPVHPAALRLLLMRALFEGANTQDVERVAFGDEIQFTSGLRKHPGVMIDLSPRGCRLLTRHAPRPGATLSVHIPADENGKAVSVDGQVTRVAPGSAEGGADDEMGVGVRFKPMRRTQAERLKQILQARQNGPKTLSSVEASPGPVTTPTLAIGSARPAPARKAGPKPGPKTALRPEPAAAVEEDPNLNPRAVYEGKVEAFCAGATRLLVGRDLSVKGMLVEPNARLKVGERVRLFLHGASREEPMLVEAHVARDDGKRGLALHFDWMEPSAQERLERLIDTLPKVRRLRDDTATHTAVFAQLVPRLRRTG